MDVPRVSAVIPMRDMFGYFLDRLAYVALNAFGIYANQIPVFFSINII